MYSRRSAGSDPHGDHDADTGAVDVRDDRAPARGGSAPLVVLPPLSSWSLGVQGQHWGPPEGDLFGRASRRFERMGVEALLINCLPVDHVPGMVSWLRDFTALPLGVYPNLGDYGVASGASTPISARRSTRRWRASGGRKGAQHRGLLWCHPRARGALVTSSHRRNLVGGGLPWRTRSGGARPRPGCALA